MKSIDAVQMLLKAAIDYNSTIMTVISLIMAEKGNVNENKVIKQMQRAHKAYLKTEDYYLKIIEGEYEHDDTDTD